MKKHTYLSERVFMSHAKALLACTFIAAAIIFSSTIAGASALGTAGEFNTFIFGDYACTSDAEGRVAVGGNMDVSSYSVAYKLADQSGQDMLIVGGDLSFIDGRVYYGNIVVGGSATFNHENPADGTVSEGLDPLPIDFTAEMSYLKTLSENLSKLPATGTAQNEWGGWKLSGDGSSDLQVFHLDGEELLANAWGIEAANIPSGATVVINISGKTAGFENMNFENGTISLRSIQERVLFNFYDAKTLKMSGVAVRGSILAPSAHVDNPQGVLWGTIVAASWSGPMQQNHVPFEGELPEEESCTPEIGDVTCGTAVVDGKSEEWDLTEDFYAAMYEAGNSGKSKLSNLYLRYDVLTETMYVLVLREGDWVPDASAQDAWVKIYDLGQSPQVDGNSDDFKWVYDGGALVGYEAAFAMVNGEYAEFEAHLSVGGGKTSSTGKKKQGYIPLTVDCPELPPSEPASLGDFVWEDTNGNGEQEAEELGVEGVTVKLYTCDDTFVQEITTDADGKYLFEDLEPGDYYVEFSNLPNGFVFTAQGPVGTSDATDSDADVTTGRTECTTLESGENDLTWDAGIVKGAEITKYQRLDDADEWTIDPLYGLQAGETLSYQISVENFYYAADLGFTLLDTLSNFVDFSGLRGVEKVDAAGNTVIMEENTDYFFNYDVDLHALSLDYTSTLQSNETLNFLFDVTANEGFGSDMAIENQANVSFNGESQIDSNIVNTYAVPEPGTIALLGLGLCGIFGLKRKFKKS